MTLERIASLRSQSAKHRETARDSRRYEVYFAEMQKAFLLKEQIAALETETIKQVSL